MYLFFISNCNCNLFSETPFCKNSKTNLKLLYFHGLNVVTYTSTDVEFINNIPIYNALNLTFTSFYCNVHYAYRIILHFSFWRFQCSIHINDSYMVNHNTYEILRLPGWEWILVTFDLINRDVTIIIFKKIRYFWFTFMNILRLVVLHISIVNLMNLKLLATYSLILRGRVHIPFVSYIEYSGMHLYQ